MLNFFGVPANADTPIHVKTSTNPTADEISPASTAESSGPLETGAQRLPLVALQAWQKEAFGMFIHFGMSTFDGAEFSAGDKPSAFYAPDALDVDQWVRVARDAGMKYAVLTAKHVSGHCLWPSRFTDYHVGTGGNRTDVVGEFVSACRRHGIKPGLYYCLWDNHHKFGSVTPSDVMAWNGRQQGSNENSGNPFDVLRPAFTTAEANTFFLNQITELLTQYGNIFEMWIDIPGVVGRAFRQHLYWEIARLQPDTVIMMNNGFGDGTQYPVDYAWPADLMAIERWLPNSTAPFNPWREIEGKRYYLPAEVCDPIGREWFFTDADQARCDKELLGMFLTCRGRNTNLLLNVPPDRSGRIPEKFVEPLIRLRRNLDLLGFEI